MENKNKKELQIKEESIDKAVKAFHEAPCLKEALDDTFDALEMEEVEKGDDESK